MGKILLKILLTVIAIPLAVLLLMQSPFIQTRICGRITQAVSRNIDGTISIGRFHYLIPATLVINDALLSGPDGDTLLHCGRVIANARFSSFFRDTVEVRRISVSNCILNIKQLNDSTSNLSAFIASLSSGNEKDSSLPWSGLSLVMFRTSNLSVKKDGVAIADGASIGISDAGLSANRLECNVKCHSSNGMEPVGLSDVSVRIKVCDTTATITGVHYKDRYSDIRIPYAGLRYLSLGHFTDSLICSNLSITLDSSRVGLGSAALFDKKFTGNGRYFTVAGKVGGTTDDIRLDGLHIATGTGKSILNISGNLKGMPCREKADYWFSLDKSAFTPDDILCIVSEISGTSAVGGIASKIPDKLKYKKIRSTMSVRGSKGKMEGSASIRIADAGEIDVAAVLDDGGGPGRRISGTITTRDLDIGGISSIEKAGKLSAEVAGSVIFGKDTSVYISDMLIDEMEFNGYGYHDIRADAEYRKKHLEANLSSTDTNLTFSVYANCDIHRGGDSRISTFIDLSNADLDAIKLTKSNAQISLIARSDVVWTSDFNMLGKIDIGSLSGEVDNGKFKVGGIKYRSGFSDGIYNIRINSDVLTGNYTGTSHPAEVVEDILANLSEKIPSRISPRTLAEREQDTAFFARMSLRTGDIRHLMSIVYPKLHVDPDTQLDFSYENRSDLNLNVRSGLLAYDKMIIKDAELNVTGGDGPMRLDIVAGTAQYGAVKMLDNRFSAALDSDRIDARLLFDNRNAAEAAERGNKADIGLSLQFRDTVPADRVIIADIHKSTVDFRETGFAILPARIRIAKNAMEIDSLSVQNSESSILANGTISDSASDTLRIVADDFDMAALNVLLLNSEFDLEGHLSGSADISCVRGGDFSFFTGISATNVAVGGSPMGDFRILSKWDKNKERINLLVSNTFDGDFPLNISGWYKPSSRNLDVNVCIDRMSVNYVPELAPAVFMDMDGTVSGDIRISGPLDSLSISSSGGKLNDVFAVVEYTHVPYRLDGGFSVDTEGVKLNGINILDQYGSRGLLNGTFKFNRFKNPELDLRFDVRNILGVNTTYQQAADGFYGNIKATGKVRIHGPVKGLMIDIDAKTDSGNIHIPNSDSYKRKNALLTFVNAERTSENAFDSLITVKNGKTSQNIKRIGTTTTINVEATPAVNIAVDLNSTSSDIITATGNGNLEMISGNNHFEVKGVYALTEGYCKMSVLGISAKDFTVLGGSTVNFNGELDKTEFNAIARYSTKASIETLIGDNSSVSTRRTVNSDIYISGSLANPELKFKIDIPDLEPATKARVENALSTDEKNLKQSVALLVSGSFVPDENGGIVNSNTLLYSNASEILSNQVSNIFHQLDIPVDLGFKYQPSSNGINVFDVAVSTQLFHNRVNINGSIGNQQYMTGGASTEIVGNVDVEIKLNKSGKLRLNLFSHAADKYSNYLDQAQRNGMGIVWQEEFNTWKELWSNILRRSGKQGNR